MPRMNLNEEEAKVIRQQFGVYMSGNFTADNVFLSDEMMMHTDSYCDSHADSHADALPIQTLLPIPNLG
jgi:hypothetical protein